MNPPPLPIFPGNATVDKLEDFISNINSVLESLYIEIKKGATEDDGRPIYALVCVRKCPLVALWETGAEASTGSIPDPLFCLRGWRKRQWRSTL